MASEIVLGMGGCVDHEVVWDADAVSSLAREHGIGLADLREAAGPVHGEREMLLALLAFMSAGVGGERFVEDPMALSHFASRFTTRVSLGGSCVRAAAVLDRLGISSLVHLVSIDDDVRRLLPSRVVHLCSAVQDSTDPHVIVQYPSGARVRLVDGEVVAPRANRVILVNDPPNQVVAIAPGYGLAVSTARVVQISGFNTMLSRAMVAERTQQVRDHLARRRPDAVVVYEDAGFHDDSHRDVVRDVLADAVDVWSMNEDEAQLYLGRSLDLLDAHDVADGVGELRRELGVSTLVVHTVRWALAHGDLDVRTALASGIATATARYGYGDGWQAEDRDTVAALPVDPELALLADRVEGLLGGRAAVVPVPRVDVPVPTTVGLGDTFLGGFIAGLVST